MPLWRRKNQYTLLPAADQFVASGSLLMAEGFELWLTLLALTKD